MCDSVASWEEAVLFSCKLLVDSGCVTEQYSQACVASVKDNGPYIVFSPGVALAHARPNLGVKVNGLAALCLLEPVVFGHPVNDPVDIVLAFCAETADSHIVFLKSLASALSAGLAKNLRGAVDVGQLQDILGKVFEN